MTPELCASLGRAVGDWALSLASHEGPLAIVVGRDTRRSGEMLEAALAAGCMSAGADVRSAGVLPTPGIAHLTRSLGAGAGLVISASHNPHWDNGVKVFGADGFKLTDDEEAAIEARIEQLAASDAGRAAPESVGQPYPVSRASDLYLESLRRILPGRQPLAGLRLVVDAANGAGHEVAPRLFIELGADVHVIGVEPDGLNINDGVGATAPEAAARRVREVGAELGVVLDGDGDRLVLIDEEGEVLDGDEVLAMSAVAMKERGALRGGAVVATVMSNIGLEVALSSCGLTLVRTAVGDRYVVEAMRQNGCNLGGEQSGHLIFLDHATTGDGLAAALVVLGEMGRSHRPLSELRHILTRFPQVRRNVVVREKRPLAQIEPLRIAVAAAEEALGDRGRVLVRYSGTEPKARIMVEGEDPDAVERWAERIASSLRDVLGAPS